MLDLCMQPNYRNNIFNKNIILHFIPLLFSLFTIVNKLRLPEVFTRIYYFIYPT